MPLASPWAPRVDDMGPGEQRSPRQPKHQRGKLPGDLSPFALPHISFSPKNKCLMIGGKIGLILGTVRTKKQWEESLQFQTRLREEMLFIFRCDKILPHLGVTGRTYGDGSTRNQQADQPTSAHQSPPTSS